MLIWICPKKGDVVSTFEEKKSPTFEYANPSPYYTCNTYLVIFGSVKSVEGAKNVIMDLVGDVEEGGVYEGTVIEIRDYGAVIELLRNKEGLLHVSEITDDKIKHPGGKHDLTRCCCVVV
jgi:hypothetical protein